MFKPDVSRSILFKIQVVANVDDLIFRLERSRIKSVENRIYFWVKNMYKGDINTVNNKIYTLQKRFI